MDPRKCPNLADLDFIEWRDTEAAPEVGIERPLAGEPEQRLAHRRPAPPGRWPDRCPDPAPQRGVPAMDGLEDFTVNLHLEAGVSVSIWC